jgi:hypothetical protein
MRRPPHRWYNGPGRPDDRSSSQEAFVSGVRDRAVELAVDWALPPPADEAEALRNLVQAYAFLTDAGDATRLAELFTADASWDGTDLGYGSADGAQAIAALVTAHHRPDAPMMHLPGPPLLVARSATEVHGVLWCTATRATTEGRIPTIYFIYEDEFVRVDGAGWRFRRRTLRPAIP